MGIEELNFSSAVLQGAAFSGLADLVADLAAQKDSGTAGAPGLTYTEMQNLVKSFGLQTMASLGRQGKVDASGQFLWTLPLSEVKKLSVPVVIGSDIVRDIFADKDSNLASGDYHFIQGLNRGFVDISSAKIHPTNLRVVDDLSKAVGPGFEFPRGIKLDAIDWFDLSSVVKAKNIRFDSRSEVTDISAIYSLFHQPQIYNTTLANVRSTDAARSKDRLADGRAAKVQGSTNAYGSQVKTDLSFNERDRDYLNFLNLFVPTPGYEDVSKCGIATIAPYLEAGLFKHNVGYGLNKEYLTTASAMKLVIRNNVRGTNSDRGANLTNEFQILKDYGFTKAKVYEAYAAELTYGVDPTSGDAYDVVSSAAAAPYSTTTQESPEDIQTQFASVFGSSGGLADQLNEFQTMPTFNDVSGGIALAQLKAASDVKSWVEYINKVKDFVNGDQDHHWSEKGIAFPINKVGSVRERWENFQEVLAVDPRLSHLPNLTLTSGQDERLRILLETIANADASSNVVETLIDLSFSSWEQNDMTLGIHHDLDNKATYIKDGEFYDAATGNKRTTTSIWAAAVKHGWSDATEVYGNLKGSGIFMMDSQYNVRSRVRELDRQNQFTKLNQTVRNQWLPSQDPDWLRKNMTDLSLGNGVGVKRCVYEYFTPGHFQDAFFDMTNLQHTANVALRYFDLETQATTVDDVVNNVTNIGNIISYSLPLRTMDKIANTASATTRYAGAEQHNRIGWVYNELVKKSFNTTKAAVAEITSWRPVPPALYVDTSDVTGYVNITKRQKDAKKAGDYVYNANQADYDNRNLPGAMVHVMANFFAKATSHNNNSDAELIALLDLHPVETLRAFNRMSSNEDVSSGTFANLETAIGVYNTMSSSHDSDQMIERMLKALVHYGKPASHFNKIGATAKLAINAYESEVKDWASDMGNTMGVFGDDADVFSMVQHLGYWVPYLSQYTPEEIAEEAATDDDIQNISDKARAFMLGLLLAATRGTLASSRPGDAAARIAGLNAFHAGGIPRTLVDIAYTLRGINIFANLSGSNYDQ